MERRISSPFREAAERVLAHYYKKDGKKEEALAHFLHLTRSQDGKTRDIRVFLEERMYRPVYQSYVTCPSA